MSICPVFESFRPAVIGQKIDHDAESRTKNCGPEAREKMDMRILGRLSTILDVKVHIMQVNDNVLTL